MEEEQLLTETKIINSNYSIIVGHLTGSARVKLYLETYVGKQKAVVLMTSRAS